MIIDRNSKSKRQKRNQTRVAFEKAQSNAKKNVSAEAGVVSQKKQLIKGSFRERMMTQRQSENVIDKRLDLTTPEGRFLSKFRSY